MIKFVNIARKIGAAMLNILKKMNWEGLFLICLILICPFLTFYNLELNPRPWQDEGAYLTLAKTLAEDGIYAIKASSGYQTYGAVQSVGPTVIVPVAWVFRIFGSTLLNGRIVSGIYLLFTLILFYFTAHALFGRKNALFAVLFLLVSPTVKYLLYGRPLLGEAPALGYFLASWLLWSYGVRRQTFWPYIFSGICLGAAIVTKSQYLLIGFASIGMLVLLDLLYYRLGQYKGLILIGFMAIACVGVWYLWQFTYFGDQVFFLNLSKLGELAGVTTGFNLKFAVDAFRFLFGAGSGYLYIFWGFPALIYSGVLASRKTRDGLLIAFFVVFTVVWLAYFTFFTIPWSRYIFPPAAILAIFVSKLFLDLFTGMKDSFHSTWLEVKAFVAGNSKLSSIGMMGVGTFLALFVFTFWAGYNLQRTIRYDVLDKVGTEAVTIYSPPQFSAPKEIAGFLNESVPMDMIVETWERELGILTEHKYHYPDQSLLAKTHKIVYRENFNDPSYGILGKNYFESVNPDYVVVGWYSRVNHVYDIYYLFKHATLVETVGSGAWEYEVYKLNKP